MQRVCTGSGFIDYRFFSSKKCANAVGFLPFQLKRIDAGLLRRSSKRSSPRSIVSASRVPASASPALVRCL